MIKNVLILIFFIALSGKAFSEQLPAYEGYFDAPYSDLAHPIVDDQFNKSSSIRNDVESMIEMQTSIKSQGSRGTCSIFSATALLEAVLNREGLGKIDLSEEWLEFLVMIGRTSDGSNSYKNFRYLKRYGTVLESTWEYIGEDWTKTYNSLKEPRCGHLEGDKQTTCYLGHRDHALLRASTEELTTEGSQLYDPEFAKIKKAAYTNKHEVLNKFFNDNRISVYSTSELKEYLDKKIPLTMGIQVHYASWAHRLADNYGITRDTEQFSNGIVTYPEIGSLDREISSQSDKRAGHSVVIVGYDNDRVVTGKMKMTDGTIKEFSYKGVYYFKNSWGTFPFGSKFEIDGINYPGYGMITQKYAHEFGSFYVLPVNYSDI
jgi:hypothetical protein